MRLVRPRDGFEGRCNVSELALAQLAREVQPDPAEVSPRRRANELSAAWCEPGHHHSRVSIRSFTLYKAIGHQLVDQPGQPARRKHHALGELGHLQGSLRCPREAHQHVVSAERETMLLAKFGVKRASQVVVRVQERLPRAERRIAQP